MRKRKKIGFLVLTILCCLILHVVIEVFNIHANLINTLPFYMDSISRVTNLQKNKKNSFAKITVQCSRAENCLLSELNYTGSKILIDVPTPKDFLDVPKVKSKKNKNTTSNKSYLQPIEAFPDDDPKSPKILLKRAMASPQNSSLATFLRIQKERRDWIQLVCRKEFGNKTQFPVGASQIFQNIIIDRDDFLSFCPIYKAASTTWSIILMQMRGLWREPGRKNVKIQSLLEQIFQKVSNIIAPWVTEGTIKFLIVRHPFERLVSCYRDKFEGANKLYYYFRYGETMVRMFRRTPSVVTKEEALLLLDSVKNRLEKGSVVILPGNPYADPIGPTFEEFIRYVIYGKFDDEHWRPYYRHCSVCQVKYNIILRFENLFSDSLQFLEYLNRTDVAGTRWDNPTSKGSTTKEVVCKYLSQIDSQLLQILIKKYEIDFKLFHYSWNQYANCTQVNLRR